MVSEMIHTTLILIVCILAICDFIYMKIPNIITFPITAISIACYVICYGIDGLLFSIKGFIIGSALLLLPYSMGGMGAGDVKMMGAIGAIVGSKDVFSIFIFTSLLGGLYALIILFANHGHFRRLLKRYWIMLRVFALTKHFIFIPPSNQEQAPKLCYGVAIAGGTLTYILLKSYGYEFPI